MSVGYTWVQWSRHKRVYDTVVALSVLAFIGIFAAISKSAWTGVNAVSDEIVVLRALGACAFTLLTVILCIGPLARIDRRFLPVLYNRRHLGVITFLVALAHGVLAVGYYHGFGVLNPLVSLLSGNTGYFSARSFPFQVPGAVALAVMFLLAATSHDFWLKNLSPQVWKGLHMLVYIAYALLVAHVAFGALQTDRGVLAPLATIAGVTLVVTLHVISGAREWAKDRGTPDPGTAGAWIDAGLFEDIPADRARIVCAPDGERIAVFRHAGGVSAVTNVCAHQGGPLGEGKIIDGCITCPWHGWQYKPGDGCSPPPFTEKIATYQVRVIKGHVEVNPRALAPGTPVEPARPAETDHD